MGLVPFRIEGIRTPFAPAISNLSAFPESNVRTYLHRKGKDPGVWFFSLDADQIIATMLARIFYYLPYHHAKTSVIRSDRNLTYRSLRRSGESAEIDVQVGGSLGMADLGSLEFFLIEPYLLYAAGGGCLYSARVHHEPYQLKRVAVTPCEQSLLEA